MILFVINTMNIRRPKTVSKILRHYSSNNIYEYSWIYLTFELISCGPKL